MKLNKLTITIGYDQSESIAYHTFCQSIIERSSIPVQFIPLALDNLYFYKEDHIDGSNKFIYSRFLTPYLCEFKGYSIYADGDMICNTDIANVLSLVDPTKAVQVVKHKYKTKMKIKYLNKDNLNYPRKNWSSFIIFNNEHGANKILTPDFIQKMDGKYLHRFSWLNDDEIGEIPIEWNWLAIEYEKNLNAKIIHYTLGTPCFEKFKNSDMSNIWWDTYTRLNKGIE